MLEKALSLEIGESFDWRFMLSIYEIYKFGENLYMITDLKLGEGYSIVSKQELEDISNGKIRLLDLQWQ